MTAGGNSRPAGGSGVFKINMIAMESYYYVVLVLSLLAIYLFGGSLTHPWV